ncbi:MAG: hypothetical protein CNE95_06460 [Puniceicoccaceae bacterium MED-G30]|nr:MAG: hypothetical protein CNE95_06460 [Puniceicoccaceae bacterium MED-G30]
MCAKKPASLRVSSKLTADRAVLPVVSTAIVSQLLDAFDKRDIYYNEEREKHNLPVRCRYTIGNIPAHLFLSFTLSVLQKNKSHLHFDGPVHSTTKQLLQLGVCQKPHSFGSLIESIANCFLIHSDLIRLKYWKESDQIAWLGIEQHPAIKKHLLSPYLGIQLSTLIQIIRYTEAADWLPSQIMLPLELSNIEYAPLWLQKCQIRLDKNHTAVRMNPSILEKSPYGFLQIARNTQSLINGISQPALGNSACNAIESVLLTYLKATNTIPSYLLMAEMNGISHRSLSRKLNKEGLNYRNLVLRTRIQLSKEYLKTGNEKIETIANQIGYPRCSSFVRSFQKLTGSTPTQYRKMANSQTTSV